MPPKRKKSFWAKTKRRLLELKAQLTNGLPPPPDEEDSRLILLHDAVANKSQKFSSNYISTTKYTFYNFLPLCLLEQLLRVANMYFLIIGILFFIPAITPLPQGGGQWSMILALAFVVTVSMIKEGMEDWKRYQSDKDLNSSKTSVLRNGTFQEVRWDEVVVGDKMMIKSEEQFPADIAMIASSGPQSTCYIETANLDGETNLKIKNSIKETTAYDSPEKFQNLSGEMEAEPPSVRLYQFSGKLSLNSRETPMGVDNLLLRGSLLRNTEWIYGIAVYTGNDTRLMRNQQKKKLKRSRVEALMTKQLLIIFIILLAMAIFSGVASIIWKNVMGNSMWYLETYAESGADSFARFITFVLLYSQIVPISLYVSLEIVKVAQAGFIMWDIDMYDPESDTPAVARTSNINEELGQIQYVFSDKTGTLTRNVMQFKKCSVGGFDYGDPEDNGSLAGSQMSAPSPKENFVMGSGIPASSDSIFRDPRLLQDLNGNAPHGELIREFLTMLAVCHTVVPEKKSPDRSKIKYQASSPDEEALVKAGRELGFIFETRTPSYAEIFANGQTERYEILNVLEFNSDRKRMSVVCRTPSGEIKLYTKGADVKIFERLKPNDPYKDATQKQLERFAADGLRTLCFARAILDPLKYEKWNEQYNAASIELVDREQKIDDIAEMIEKDLELVGASAIEDRLQDGVPDTLRSLGRAKIKLWVLTGDKQETAINIGFSCGLLEHTMKLIVLNEETEDASCKALDDAIERFLPMAKEGETLALVIDGHTLAYTLDKKYRERFMTLGRECATCICCRVTPLQKAQVVRLVREVENKVTLAIGDGANDVSMIQAAHVGVGISGKEGMQAVLASDFSIAQFRFLKKLLLVHGRWSYKRIAKLILYSFYKNTCLAWTYFWFTIVSGYSGQTLYDGWVSGLYNVVFAAVPVLVMATQDQDISASISMENPELYIPGQRNTGFNYSIFWSWFFTGIVHSVPIFWLSYIMLDAPIGNGQILGSWSLGICVFTNLVTVITLKLALQLSTWNFLNHFFTWASLAVYLSFIAVYSTYGFINIAAIMYYVGLKVYSAPYFWLIMFVVPIITLLPDFTWRFIRRNYTRTKKVELQSIAKKSRRKKDHKRKAVLEIDANGRHVSQTYTGFAFSSAAKGQADLIAGRKSIQTDYGNGG